MFDGLKEERKPFPIMGILLHWVWVLYFLSFASNPYLTYFVFHICEGVLAVMLVSNHYLKDWVENGELKEQNFFERQLEVNINYISHPTVDWFFIGLNFHHEHHCFPKMPR